LSLSIADLGTGEDSEEDNFMEGKLTRWLNLAETWNAVLLIDEADVFLERRGKDNIARNGLVSVFLRKIEYFSGLLFLTTNRIGQIDDAFPSRLHAIINYPPLDDSKRIAIWKAFFKKLSLERKGQLVIESKAQEYVLHHQDIRDRKWNGREIRNALQTAIALAEYDVAVEPDLQDQKIRVNKDHFQQVMDMSRKFTEYMADLSGKTEAERARSRKDRSDDHHRGDLGFEEGRLTPYRTG
jgi:SpoVK/Ycf46/Vps4 family AAA+-type ATPase